MGIRLGSNLLTETMERRPELGLGSYDRLVPNQDTLPKGGFGNLIALPLQKRPRQLGNTVFLDEQFKPYADQWAFLASLLKISRSRVEVLTRQAESTGRIIGVRAAIIDENGDTPLNTSSSRHPEPTSLGPLPESLDLVLSDQIYFTRETLPTALLNPSI